MKLTIGSDPEVLLYDPSKNEFKPAIGLLGGTKDNPKETPHGFVQEDNVMAEFNIQPATNKDELQRSIEIMLQEVQNLVSPLAITRFASAIYPETIRFEPQAMSVGCEPDFNAWINRQNIPPMEIVNGTKRCAGGHVHVGVDIPDKHYNTLVRALDVGLGVPATILDSDLGRREFYGKAGSYRPKPYGVEYRVLSNFWIFKPQLIEWIWDSVTWAVDNFEKRRDDIIAFGDDIHEAINNLNTKVAEKLISNFNIGMPI